MLLYLSVPGSLLKSGRVCPVTWLPLGQSVGGKYLTLALMRGSQLKFWRVRYQKSFWETNSWVNEFGLSPYYVISITFLGKQIRDWNNLTMAPYYVRRSCLCHTVLTTLPPILWPVFMPVINTNMFIQWYPSTFCLYNAYCGSYSAQAQTTTPV